MTDDATLAASVIAARHVFGWQHLSRYSRQSPEWLEATLAAMVRAAVNAAAENIKADALEAAATAIRDELKPRPDTNYYLPRQVVGWLFGRARSIRAKALH